LAAKFEFFDGAFSDKATADNDAIAIWSGRFWRKAVSGIRLIPH
jgi:hypothetical protein